MKNQKCKVISIIKYQSQKRSISRYLVNYNSFYGSPIEWLRQDRTVFSGFERKSELPVLKDLFNMSEPQASAKICEFPKPSHGETEHDGVEA